MFKLWVSWKYVLPNKLLSAIEFVGMLELLNIVLTKGVYLCLEEIQDWLICENYLEDWMLLDV